MARVTDSKLGRLVAAWVGNPLFDAQWYRAHCKDAPGGVRIWVHWRRHGWREGRKPCEQFDTRWYLERYPDVAARWIEPLEHYLRRGSREGRRPSLTFDPGWYRERYPDVAATGTDLLLHYLRHGRKERRVTGPSGSWTGRT
jgi:hypothetical protein